MRTSIEWQSDFHTGGELGAELRMMSLSDGIRYREYFKQEISSAELTINALSYNILLYKTRQGEARIEVIFNNETLWMSQKRMAELYDVDVRTVNYHLSQIFESGELQESATIRKIGIVQMEGDREVNRPCTLPSYN